MLPTATTGSSRASSGNIPSQQLPAIPASTCTVPGVAPSLPTRSLGTMESAPSHIMGDQSGGVRRVASRGISVGAVLLPVSRTRASICRSRGRRTQMRPPRKFENKCQIDLQNPSELLRFNQQTPFSQILLVNLVNTILGVVRRPLR